MSRATNFGRHIRLIAGCSTALLIRGMNFPHFLSRESVSDLAERLRTVSHATVAINEDTGASHWSVMLGARVKGRGIQLATRGKHMGTCRVRCLPSRLPEIGTRG